jgi:ATP-dependent Clp protease ATP-binding subunit ClpA
MDRKMAELILTKKLTTLEKQLANKNIQFTISDETKEYLLKIGFSPTYGGREIDRVISSKIKPLLMKAILHGSLTENMIAHLHFSEEHLSIEIKPQ